MISILNRFRWNRQWNVILGITIPPLISWNTRRTDWSTDDQVSKKCETPKILKSWIPKNEPSSLTFSFSMTAAGVHRRWNCDQNSWSARNWWEIPGAKHKKVLKNRGKSPATKMGVGSHWFCPFLSLVGFERRSTRTLDMLLYFLMWRGSGWKDQKDIITHNNKHCSDTRNLQSMEIVVTCLLSTMCWCEGNYSKALIIVGSPPWTFPPPSSVNVAKKNLRKKRILCVTSNSGIVRVSLCPLGT